MGVLTSDTDSRVYGLSLHYSVIFLSKLRQSDRYDPLFLTLVLLEELLHSIYLINDEWEVKEIAISMVQQKIPGAKLHIYFPDYFDDHDQWILFDFEAELQS